MKLGNIEIKKKDFSHAWLLIPTLEFDSLRQLSDFIKELEERED